MHALMLLLVGYAAKEAVLHFARKLARNLFQTLVDGFLVTLKFDSAFKLERSLKLVAVTSLFAALVGLGFCLCKTART
jgi:hypothetical protein